MICGKTLDNFFWSSIAYNIGVTTVTASAPIVSSGGTTPNISVATTGSGLNVVLQTTPTLITPVLGVASGTSLNLSGLTASYSVHTDSSKNLVSIQNNGTGLNILQTSPTLITPTLGLATGTSISFNGTSNYIARTISSSANFGLAFTSTSQALGSFLFANNDASVGYIGINVSGAMLAVTGNITATDLTLSGLLTLGSKNVALVPTCAGSRYIVSGTTSLLNNTNTQIGNWVGSYGIGPFDLTYSSGIWTNLTGRSMIVTVSYTDQINTGLVGVVKYVIVKNGATIPNVEGQMDVAAGSSVGPVNVTATVLLANNDFVSLLGYQNSGFTSTTVGNGVINFNMIQI